MTVRISRVSIRYNRFPGCFSVLFVDVAVSTERKLFTFCYCLPQETPERMERRISLLLKLSCKKFSELHPEH